MTDTPSLPRPPVDATLLVGRTVDLERVDVERHGPGLWQAIGLDRSLWSLIPPGPFDDEASFTEWLRDRSQRSDLALYAVIDKRGPRPQVVGLYFLLQINPAMGTAEIGLIYGAALSRQTGGTEAFFLLAGYVLETLGYRRLEWRCAASHTASRRAALRFGFTAEGILRQTAWAKGENWDTAVFSILDREWPAIGARLAAWLTPDNFTESGHQIKALAEFA